MYQEAFTKLELSEIATILDQVNPKLDGTVFDAVETTILAQDISFYPGYRLLDIADHTSTNPIRRFVVYKADDFIVLNFTNEPIYALNEKLPIKLTEDNIRDYVWFFFTYVRGRHGRFIITENIDDIQWKEEPPPSARKAISAMLSATNVQEITSEGQFTINATMVFKDSLFRSTIKIDANGAVSLSNEELLIEDLPVMDDTFGQ